MYLEVPYIRVCLFGSYYYLHCYYPGSPVKLILTIKKNNKTIMNLLQNH